MISGNGEEEYTYHQLCSLIETVMRNDEDRTKSHGQPEGLKFLSALLLAFDRPVDINGRQESLQTLLSDERKNQEAVLTRLQQAILEQLVEPLHNAIKDIDAEQLLKLKRCETDERTFIRPIHDQISPACKGSSVRYLRIIEVKDVCSVGIFVFPPGGRIPLHDHPGMCVISRVLYGKLTSQSYDWIRHTTDKKREAKRHKSSSHWVSRGPSEVASWHVDAPGMMLFCLHFVQHCTPSNATFTSSLLAARERQY